MGQVTIIDNFLSDDQFKEIQNFLINDHFPWYFNDYVTSDKDTEGLDNFQFTHTFFDNLYPRSEHISRIDPIISALGPKSLVKIKANLLPGKNTIIEYDLHTDCSPPLSCKTAVYYINTNNGYTFFESGERVISRENRMVIFDGNLKHAGTTCSDKKTRILVNFNFYDE